MDLPSMQILLKENKTDKKQQKEKKLSLWLDLKSASNIGGGCGGREAGVEFSFETLAGSLGGSSGGEQVWSFFSY